jgi:PAS domain S-box-containing protein
LRTDSVTTNELFDLLTKATRDAVWHWDIVADTVWWNEGYTTLFDHPPQETTEDGLESWSRHVHPDDKERILTSIHQAVEQGLTNWSDEYRFGRANGSYATVLDRGYVLHREGSPIRMVGSMQDISDRIALQQAHQEGEERLRFALDSAQLGTWELDPVRGVVEWDARCQALCGLVNQDLQRYGQTLDYIHADDKEWVNQAVQWALKPESGGRYDARFRTVDVSDGRVRWVRFIGQTYFTSSGEAYRFSGIAQDITEEVLAKEKAALSDQQAKMALEGSGAGSFWIDLVTGEMVYSPAFSRILTGVEKPERHHIVFVQHVYPEDRPIREQAHEVALQTGSVSYEARFVWHDTTIHWVKILGQYLFDAEGKPISITGIVLDITEQVAKNKALREAEDRLQFSEERFRNMILQAPVAIGMLDGRKLVIETANNSMLEIWGKDESIIGQPMIQALPELVGQRVIGAMQEVYDSGIAQYGSEILTRLQHGDQLQDAYFNFVYAPLRDDSKRVNGVAVIAVNVTEQVLSRQAIEESETRFRTLLEAIVQITWTNTPDGTINFFNQRWYNYTGQRPGQTDVMGWQEAIHPDDLPNTLAVYKKALADGTTFELENRYRRGTDGQYRWHLNRALPLRDEAGEITLWVGTATDIQEQKLVTYELEQQVLSRTEQLTASNLDLRRSNENLEKFAYIASHDLQEPLRKIQSFGDILKNQHGLQLGEGISYLERMQSAASRMSALIKDLLVFSRISTRQETTLPVDLNQVVTTVVEDMELGNAQLNIAVLPTVLGDGLQLGQLFLNLLSNALKFQKSDTVPVVQVNATQVTAAALPVDVKPARRAVLYHCISVADNGIGFDEKYLDRIFQVFQRLHNRSEYAGTGIGLAICEKVAANHGGTITASSKPGQGATFAIYLPVM